MKTHMQRKVSIKGRLPGKEAQNSEPACGGGVHAYWEGAALMLQLGVWLEGVGHCHQELPVAGLWASETTQPSPWAGPVSTRNFYSFKFLHNVCSQ